MVEVTLRGVAARAELSFHQSKKEEAHWEGKKGSKASCLLAAFGEV
jgi:hypothetical protein